MNEQEWEQSTGSFPYSAASKASPPDDAKEMSLEWTLLDEVHKSEAHGFRYTITGDGETILLHWGDEGELIDVDMWYVESKRRKLDEAKSYCLSHARQVAAHALRDSKKDSLPNRKLAELIANEFHVMTRYRIGEDRPATIKEVEDYLNEVAPARDEKGDL